MSRYGEFSGEGSAAEMNEALIVETSHWLDEFPEVKKIYAAIRGGFGGQVLQ
jgi:hypothetical protein